MSDESPASPSAERLWIPADNRPAPLSAAPIPLLADPVSQMSFGERAAFDGILNQSKPGLAIEIGTYEGGSLRFLAAHCGHVFTFDLYDLVEDRTAFDNVTFHVGDSKVLLPELLAQLEDDGQEVDFVLIDGDHSADGVYQDLANVLDSRATSSTLIVLHDTMNRETRSGIERVGLADRAKVVYYELDFVPGYEYARGWFGGEIWGGLGLIVTGDRDSDGYGESPAQTLYRVPFEIFHGPRSSGGQSSDPAGSPSDTTSMLPLPPDELIDRVVSGFANDRAEEHRSMFLETGRRSFEDFEQALVAVGDSLGAHERIIEFGCGCGRIMRWMQELGDTRTLVGTDIDARAIEWAAENLPFARFDVNEGLPPTNYGDGEFDLVLNHSVFTHLDARYQDAWLAELQRITAPGGLLVLSIHGEHAFQVSEQQLDPGSRQRREWREALERDGILYVADDSYVGSAFPDFYHTAFHAPWYVFEHWGRWFEVLAYLPRSSLGFQDQIVLRRREEASVEGAEESRSIRARPGGGGGPASVAAPAGSSGLDDTGSLLAMPTDASRFGAAGMLARQALFRMARPVLHAQREVDSSFAQAIASIEARLDDRMPPLVHVALRQQAERIGRLEDELRGLRGMLEEGTSERG